MKLSSKLIRSIEHGSNGIYINLLNGAKLERELGGKSVFLNSKFQIRNFMHIQWSEDKFLKGSVGR